MGKPKDPDYWKKYRAKNAAYRNREAVLRNERRKKNGREDRSAEYAKRNAARNASRPVQEPLPQLYEELRSGKVLSFWEDELRMDLEQERVLAVLEGRDPDEAIKAYRSTETNWKKHTGPLLIPSETYEEAA